MSYEFCFNVDHTFCTFNHNLTKAIHRSGMTCDQNIIVFGHTQAVNSHSLYRQQLLPPSAISAIYFENYPTPQSSAILKKYSLHFESQLTLNVDIMNFGPRFSIRNTETLVCFKSAQRFNF